MLAIESFWTRLFSQYFVCNEDDTRDDLLFYVKGKGQNHDGKVTREAEVCMTLVESNNNNNNNNNNIYFYSTNSTIQFSNALYNSRGNQINIAQIIIFTIIIHKSNQVKCWFLMRGENRSTQGKTSHSRVENQ